MISLIPLANKYLSIDIQIIVSAKSYYYYFFWLYFLGIPQELPREKYAITVIAADAASSN